jgi:hypothetical protein
MSSTMTFRGMPHRLQELGRIAADAPSSGPSHALAHLDERILPMTIHNDARLASWIVAMKL